MAFAKKCVLTLAFVVVFPLSTIIGGIFVGLSVMWHSLPEFVPMMKGIWRD